MDLMAIINLPVFPMTPSLYFTYRHLAILFILLEGRLNHTRHLRRRTFWRHLRYRTMLQHITVDSLRRITQRTIAANVTFLRAVRHFTIHIIQNNLLPANTLGRHSGVRQIFRHLRHSLIPATRLENLLFHRPLRVRFTRRYHPSWRMSVLHH